MDSGAVAISRSGSWPLEVIGNAGGRRLGQLAVQVLLDELVDLRGALGRQSLNDLIDRLGATRVTVVDRLGACHDPSMPAWSDTEGPAVDSPIGYPRLANDWAAGLRRLLEQQPPLDHNPARREPCSRDIGLY